MLFSPELFIIGGGVSRKADKFLPLIEGIRAEIVPAELQNNAGIVGAAMRAAAEGVTSGRQARATGGTTRCLHTGMPGRSRPPVHQADPPHDRDDTRDERPPVQPAGLRGERGDEAHQRRRGPPAPSAIGSRPDGEGDRDDDGRGHQVGAAAPRPRSARTPAGTALRRPSATPPNSSWSRQAEQRTSPRRRTDPPPSPVSRGFGIRRRALHAPAGADRRPVAPGRPPRGGRRREPRPGRAGPAVAVRDGVAILCCSTGPT